MGARLIIGTAALTSALALIIYPPLNTSGKVAELTFAIAHQDAPSGIYYDREFDWPTGEVSLIEMPAFALHLTLLLVTVGAALHYCIDRVPPISDSQTLQRPSNQPTRSNSP